ncbi:MarR family transcriptional regulator [Aldersonia sp. NBC_00410]|uniref:MarR family winged helix-turn-helix transcriptional regulator n=1 Tax=Aldersonia sp. NBC_00410 TaxID=2975954 RepID=UPI00225C271B|nr:MarR family transcriptional regulator [Aldersonia sp. NBC_00410]MCX5042954.1 MarR family transcriptional regulator [Aldersonia sp. NBC_00410]
MTEPDEPPSRVREAPTWLVGQVAAHARRLLREGFAAVDSSGYQYRLLAALAEFGPGSQASLGRRTELDPSDVVARINELVDNGFVDRTPDPADRRRNIVSITKSGIRQLRKLERALDGIQEALVEPLSTDERHDLVRLLARLDAHHRGIGRKRDGTSQTRGATMP